MVELKHVFSSSNVIEFQVFDNSEYKGEATYYPPYKELRISVGKSEVVVIDGEIKKEMSVIHPDDEKIINEIIKEIFSRFK